MTMIQDNTFFTKMVDELVELSAFDVELAHGIKYLDEQAHKRGISFYDMFFEVIYNHEVNKKASDWFKDRN